MYVCMYSCGAARAQRSAVAAVYPFYHVIQRYIYTGGLKFYVCTRKPAVVDRRQLFWLRPKKSQAAAALC